MKLKIFSVALAVGVLVFAGGAMSPASAAAAPESMAVSPQVEADFPLLNTSFWLHVDGPNKRITVANGTRLKLYCWFDRTGARMFYAKILDGRFEGGEGDIWASDVIFQTVVPRC